MSNFNTNNTNDKSFLVILGLLCMCCVIFTLSASVALVVISNNEDVQKEAPSSSPSSSPSESESSPTEKPIEFVSVSFAGRPSEGTYYIQNVGSEKWAYVAPGNKMIFDKSTRQIDNTYKFEVKHVPDTTDEITLKSISQGSYCDFYTAYSYTSCAMAEGHGGKYKMSQLNTDTYFMSDKSSGVWKRCKPNTNTSDEPVFSCFSETGGETGSLAQMFKFELV
jgi:hypothetical protein